MNEVRRAGLEQIGMSVEAATSQLTAILDAERQDVKDLPDNIENSRFAEDVLKMSAFELSLARKCLMDAVEHISAAIAKAE
jgi:hypothetical protein